MIKKSYNKSDIIKRASYKLNIPNEELKIIFDSFMDVVSGMLKESNDRIHVEIRNFGSFDVIPTNSKTPDVLALGHRPRIEYWLWHPMATAGGSPDGGCIQGESA